MKKQLLVLSVLGVLGVGFIATQASPMKYHQLVLQGKASYSAPHKQEQFGKVRRTTLSYRPNSKITRRVMPTPNHPVKLLSLIHI